MSAGDTKKTSSVTNHFFSGIPLFPVIPDDGVLHLDPFLNAAAGLKSFITILGPTLFSPVSSDMQGNIDRLRKCTPPFDTVNSLVEAAMDENNAINKHEPLLALLWLTRAIQFVATFLNLIHQDHLSKVKKDDLKQYFQMAYEVSLQKYHSWFTKKIVSVILSNAPNRVQLMNALMSGDCKSFTDATDATCEDNLFKSIGEHLERIDVNVKTVHSIFDQNGYDWKK